MENEDTDRTLVERIQRGDKSACAECVERHSPGVYRVALRLRRVRPDQVSVDDEEVFGEGLPVPTQLHDWCCLPERDFESGEARAEMERAIKDLPEKLRVVFVMRDKTLAPLS